MQVKILVLLLSFLTVTIPAYANMQSNNALSTPSTLHSKIDLNKADAQQLVGSFKGIGRKKAEAIITFREKNGGIKSIDDLAEIKGFGPKFVSKNREKLSEIYSVQ